MLSKKNTWKNRYSVNAHTTFSSTVDELLVAAEKEEMGNCRCSPHTMSPAPREVRQSERATPAFLIDDKKEGVVVVDSSGKEKQRNTGHNEAPTRKRIFPTIHSVFKETEVSSANVNMTR